MNEAHVAPDELRPGIGAVDPVDEAPHVLFVALDRIGLALAGKVQRPHQGHVAPGRDDEQRSSSRETQGDVSDQRPGHEVHRLRRVEEPFPLSSLGFLEEAIDGWPRCVDHHSPADLEVFDSRESVSRDDTQDAVSPSHEVDGFDEVRDHRALPGRRKHEREREAIRVVHLGVVPERAAGKAGVVQTGRELEALLP